MRYLLDTNACIALLNGQPPALVDRVRRHTSSEFGLPAPVTYELYYERCCMDRGGDGIPPFPKP